MSCVYIIDMDVEVDDTEDLGPDGGAEAHRGVQVGQQRASGLAGRHAEPELQQVQHVGAHAQLQRVDRARAVGRRRWRRGRAVGSATAVRSGNHQVQTEEQEEELGRWRHGESFGREEARLTIDSKGLQVFWVCVFVDGPVAHTCMQVC